MSKERLKQFKNSLDFLDDSADMSDYHRLIDTLENLYKDGELDWIHRFASKQSGRVQELERQNKRYRESILKVVGDDNLSPYQKRTLNEGLEGDPHD